MTLDSFLILLSDTAWKLVPVVLVVLLIYVIILLRTGISEETAVHMNMESAGRSLMGEIPERADLLQRFFPRNFLQM